MIEAIFSTCSAAQVAAELLGFIESVEAKVDKLLRADLAAACDMLRQSEMSAKESESLLREARTCFTRAVQIEDGLRKGLALLGLAACHHQTGEARLVRDSLERILDIEVASGSDLIRGGLKHYGKALLQDWTGMRHLRMLFDAKAREDYASELIHAGYANTPGALQLIALQEAVEKYLAG